MRNYVSDQHYIITESMKYLFLLHHWNNFSKFLNDASKATKKTGNFSEEQLVKNKYE